MRHLNPIAFMVFVVVALLIVSCVTSGKRDIYRELGQPKGADISAKWLQLEEGMNKSEVAALLGTPTNWKKTSDSLTWYYPFGTVTFIGIVPNSSYLSGKDGKLSNWKRAL